MAKDEPESRPIPVSELLARLREANRASAETGEIPRVAFPRSANPVAQRAVRPQVDEASVSVSRTASGMPSFQPAVQPESTGVVVDADKATGIIPVVETSAEMVVASAETTPVTAAVPLGGPPTGSFLRTDEDVDFDAYRNFDDVIADEGPKEAKRGLFGRRKSTDGKDKQPKPKAKGKGKGANDKRAARRAAQAAAPTAPPLVPPVVPTTPAVVAPVTPAVPEVPGPAPADAMTQSVPRTLAPDPAPAPESVPAPDPIVAPAPPAVIAPIPPQKSVPGSTEVTAALTPVEADDFYIDQMVPVVDKPLVDPVTGRFSLPGAASRTAEPAADDTYKPAITPSRTRRAANTEADPSVVPALAVARPEPEADATTVIAPVVPEAKVKPSRRRATAEDSDTAVVDEAPLASKHSPLAQWLIIIGQVIAGLALGAGGFWGFVQLWRWNVYFALVLSAVVIFGIVTIVHLVRRRHDLPTTLLALGVGLFITLGPLILLATS